MYGPQQPKVRHLTPEDIASGKYTIFDVVCPVPGFGTVFPTHICGKELVESMLVADGLDPCEVWSQLRHRDMALVGAYRPMLHRAHNVEWQILQHADPLVRAEAARCLPQCSGSSA